MSSPDSSPHSPAALTSLPHFPAALRALPYSPTALTALPPSPSALTALLHLSVVQQLSFTLLLPSQIFPFCCLYSSVPGLLFSFTILPSKQVLLIAQPAHTCCPVSLLDLPHCPSPLRALHCFPGKINPDCTTSMTYLTYPMP